MYLQDHTDINLSELEISRMKSGTTDGLVYVLPENSLLKFKY